MPLAAQTTTPASVLATITTDTGAFAPGRVSFTRYTSPVECLAAARNARTTADRTLSFLDHTMFAVAGAVRPPDDSPVVTTVARQCAARFPIATVRASELSYLFELALLAHEDSVAAAVFRRRLASPLPGETRERLVTEMTATYLAAMPARVTAVEALAAREGPDGVTQSPLLAMTVWAQLLTDAARHFDRPRMRIYAEHIITLGSSLTDAASLQQAGQTLSDAYTQLIALAFVDAPDSLISVARRAQADLGRLPVPAPTVNMPHPFDIRHATIDSVLDQLSPVGTLQRQVTHATVVPPVAATYWFPRPPAPGQITLVLSLATAWLAPIDGGVIWTDGCLYDDTELFGSRVTECAGPVAWIREWSRQYGSALAMTVITRTQGSAFNSLALSARPEAERQNWYLREHLTLPVTLAVVDIPYVTRPAPDSRRVRCPLDPARPDPCRDSLVSPLVRQYLLSPATLIGAHGELLYAGPISPVLDQLLKRTLSPSNAPASAESRRMVPHDTVSHDTL